MSVLAEESQLELITQLIIAINSQAILLKN
jgi:hypothetical protein